MGAIASIPKYIEVLAVGVINLIKDFPRIIKEFIELFALLDDILLVAMKIARLLFSEVPKFISFAIEKINQLIPVITNFINMIVEISKEYKEISLIFLFLSPVVFVVNQLLNIIDIV